MCFNFARFTEIAANVRFEFFSPRQTSPVSHQLVLLLDLYLTPFLVIFGGNCWISLEDVCFFRSPNNTWYQMQIPWDHHPTEADPFVQQAVAKVGDETIGDPQKKETSRKIWVFPKIGVPQNGWFIMENPTRKDDLGVPLFSETSI